MLLTLGATLAVANPLAVNDLRCEFRVDPLGIEAANPRLSWNLQSTERGSQQSAYQIHCATAPALLQAGKADLWDSGRVESGDTLLIPYRGKKLGSNQQVFWRIRVWDSSDQSSEWSRPATWTTALKPSDWRSKWIAYDVPSPKDEKLYALHGLSWVWRQGVNAAERAPAETVTFHRTIEVPAGMLQAVFVLTVDNEFELFINDKSVEKMAGPGELWRTIRKIDLTKELPTGRNEIALTAVNTLPSPAGAIGKIVLVTQSGVTEIPLDKSWQVSGPEVLSSKSEPAQELVPYGQGQWGTQARLGNVTKLPMLRTEVALNGKIKRATAFVTGLGHFELRINGQKIGNALFEPAWTDYNDRVPYVTYDVTKNLREGQNALGILLGNGLYNVDGQRYTKFVDSFGPPKALLQLEVEYEDGRRSRITTDQTWTATDSPIVYSNIYGGEDYDARLEQPGWDKPGFRSSGWKPVTLTNSPKGRLVSLFSPPIEVREQFKTVKVSKPKAGIKVYDLGQNFSGVMRLTVDGKRGQQVKLIPAELLNPEGLVDQRSMGGGPIFYTYTSDGEPATWTPTFAYTGFRYVQAEGDVEAIRSLEGLFAYSSAEQVGRFQCSNQLVNDVHDLILDSIKSNLWHVLTDCPHREKLGWLEVSQLLGPALIYNYHLPNFFAKVQDDMRDGQLPDGLVPDFVPEYTFYAGGFRDSPEWGSASVINPWHVYLRYGDDSLLRQNYDVMKRYVDYLTSKTKGHILAHGLGDWYDLGPGGLGASKLTSLGVTGTVTYYQDLQIMELAATKLGKTDEALEWRALAAKAKEAFNKAFFDPETNTYDRGSQTAQAMPLFAGLVPPDRREAVVDSLVRIVRENKNRVTAGDVGFMYLVQALNQNGRSDVVFDLVTQKNGPGYWYMMQQGATSLPESWDADKGSSWDHCMLGHAEEWFYNGLGGIQPDPAGPGFKKFFIRPQVVGDITWVNCSYRSVRGLIESNWRIEGGLFKLEVAVPVGSTAVVTLPGGKTSEVGSGRHSLEVRL